MTTLKFILEPRINNSGINIIQKLLRLIKKEDTRYTLGSFFKDKKEIEIYLGSLSKTIPGSNYRGAYENRLIKYISRILEHEYIHTTINEAKDSDVNLSPSQEHWATEKMGVCGDLLT